MIPKFQQYKGSFPYKTDAKNRVTVVPEWRPEPGEAVYIMPGKSLEGVPVLKVLTNEAFEFRVQQIIDHIPTPKERALRKGKLVRKLRQVSVNDQNKLLIPKDLGSLVNIGPDTEVNLVAGDSHFEIWNRVEFEKHNQIDLDDDDDDLGIM